MPDVLYNRHTGIAIVEEMRRFVFPGLQVEVAGSLRRECPKIHDVDLVIMGNARDIRECLTGEKVQHITGGARRIRFTYRSMPVDVCCVSWEWEWEPMLLHHTGSCEFNVFMRAIAKAKGYKLNEYGLEKLDGSSQLITNTEEVFGELQVRLIEPTLRSVIHSHAWERYS